MKKTKYRIYNLDLENQEMYFNLKYQIGIKKAREFLIERNSFKNIICGLTPLFYDLAIMNYVSNDINKFVKKSLK